MNMPAERLNARTDLVSAMDEVLANLPGFGEETGGLDPEFLEAALLAPARDILGRSGKRLRTRLLHCAWELAGGDETGPPEMLGAVIELLHAGSLVIDDIEDDSSTRRGKPALHRRFGLPIALNTGNWLYFLPFVQLSRIELDDDVRLRLYEDISLALLKCHQGQALDLSVRVTSVPRSEVASLVAHVTHLKTGSLMGLAAILGARAAGGARREAEVLASFGARLGVGLQMLDDWSGIGVDERMTKGIEDLKLERPTWPWAWLAQDCDEFGYAELAKQVRRIAIDWEAERALERIRRVLAPVAKARIRAHLNAAVDDLEMSFGDCDGLASVREDVARLEGAYG